MTVENCLGTINMWLFWISLTMVTLSADCYRGTLSCGGHFLQKASFTSPWKCQVSYTQLDSCVCLYIRYVMDQSQSCTQCLISLNPWEAPGWQVIAIDADVKQVITSWLWTLDNSVFMLEYKPWYHCGANAKVVVATTLRYDVYHLLHMCHVLIRVPITFWHESVCYLIFWKFFVYTLHSEQVNS